MCFVVLELTTVSEMFELSFVIKIPTTLAGDAQDHLNKI